MFSGPKIRLRAIEESDLSVLSAWRFDDTNYDYFYEFPVINSTQNRKWFEGSLSNRNEVNFVVEHLEDKKVIGTISLVNIDQRSRKAEMGRVLIGNTKYHGQKIGQEMIQLVLQYALNDLNLRKIYCEVFADNIPAIKTYEKCKFITEGTFKDHVYKNGHYKDVLRMALIDSGKK